MFGNGRKTRLLCLGYVVDMTAGLMLHMTTLHAECEQLRTRGGLFSTGSPQSYTRRRTVDTGTGNLFVDIKSPVLQLSIPYMLLENITCRRYELPSFEIVSKGRRVR